MRLKTFTATSMNEALELIRKEMGPNAVIVSSADDKEGVEVTAALESGDLDFAAFEKSDDQMASTLNLINTLCTLADQQRLPERIRDHWFEAFSAQELDHPHALERSLEEMILFNPDQLFNPSSYEPLVFVGPPGCGKTVTLAKLAAYYLIQDRKIKIVTTDILKAGSLNQFKTYFDAMDQTFITADNRDTLRQIFTSLNKDEYLFVDTPGINPYNKSELYQ
ncbi:MAG: hypothetical protein HYS39_01285, partial [Proteobacteria bacterium]|nr:hypothetical protein [Pseudomonadota bacterium]